MISLRRLILAALFLAIPLAMVGCGGEECRSDHECDDEEVCEPSGCQPACDGDEDCPAGYECVARRVEEGRICAPSEDFPR